MRYDRRRLVTLLLFFSIAATVQSSENHPLVYKRKYVMGTIFEIAAYDRSSERASRAIESAFQEIVRIDDVLSNYKADSELSRLNRSAHFHAEHVPADLYRVVEQAEYFSRISDGKFDISIAPLVNLWKAALSGDAVPSPIQQLEVRRCVGYEKIELVPPDQIIFHSPCLQLDLGAIGKGYAVDRAAEVLKSSGVRNALINAGGSTILALGAPPAHDAWLIHLRDPSNKVDPQVMLKDESLSTSEQTPRSLLGKDSAGHIVDPDTGMPLKTEFAVSVIAKTATMSDGLSTTLLLLGPDKGRALIRDLPDVSAIWISPKAEVEKATYGPPVIFSGKAR